MKTRGASAGPRRERTRGWRRGKAGILIVAPDSASACALARRAEAELGLSTAVAADLQQAKALMRGRCRDLFAAVVDLGAPGGEQILDGLAGMGVASVVLTDEISDRMSEWMLSKNVIDYVVKEDGQELDAVLRTLLRARKNRNIQVMVVDDSPILRKLIHRLLAIQKYTVVEAADGVEALAQLRRHPGVKLVITDFEMPRMNGFELAARIRRAHARNELAIIGISAHGSGLLSAKFLKCGANDFLTKPFLNEEFNCRITQNIEMLEHIEAVKQAANKDYLTGFYNRRYFFDIGNRCRQGAKGAAPRLAVAMMDIDHFKNINDRYGHHAGDAVLQEVSRVLAENLSPTDIVCRLGGDEFCILSRGGRRAMAFFDSIRRQVAGRTFAMHKTGIPVTVSLGLVARASGSLESAMRRADELLYQAKKSGRNRIVADS